MPSPDSSNLNDKVSAPASPGENGQNRAFRYGDGLFETMLVHNGQVVHINFHLGRMLKGMQILGFSFIETEWKRRILAKISTLCRPLEDKGFARLRLQVYRQGGGAYLPTSDLPQLLGEIYPLEGDPWKHAEPLHVGRYTDISLQQTLLSQVKSLNALPYVLAAKHAHTQGWDDALLFASDGALAESSRANVFMVRGGSLWTPSLESGCLPGTMRAAVIAAAIEADISLYEQRIEVEELKTADELFLTNAIRGLWRVGSFEGFSPPQDTLRNKLIDILRTKGA